MVTVTKNHNLLLKAKIKLYITMSNEYENLPLYQFIWQITIVTQPQHSWFFCRHFPNVQLLHLVPEFSHPVEGTASFKPSDL